LVNGLQDSAAQKSVSISTNISSNIQSVQLDAHSLIIVLRNLIKNSIKFCRKGDKVSIETRLENNALQFCIKDTGVGFDDEVASKLFKEDEHITTYGTANEKGTGLGLLICKNLIEQSGGTIWAEGKPNQGATFCFIIPLS
jgi:signal transduction histidine kinase